MTSKEALCEILKRTDITESEYITKCTEIIIRDLDVLNDVDEEKCVKDIPADVPYDQYMNVVRENEELKETVIKLTKKLNECKFFD